MGRQIADDAERTARSAPSAQRITSQSRIADRSVIPPVRAGCSGGPVWAPEAGSAANGPLGVISAFAACHVIAEPGDAVQQAFALQQAHRPSPGLPGMTILAGQPGRAPYPGDAPADPAARPVTRAALREFLTELDLFEVAETSESSGPSGGRPVARCLVRFPKF
jgi:hypothetical protein